MKRCSKCILPETTPNISFDDNDICNYCHSYENFEYEGEEKLLELLNSQKRPDSKYEVVMGISGGRDSSYSLLKVVKDYGMKVLAVNYENPFVDPQAKKNIDNAIKALKVDFIKFKLNRNIHERTFKHNLLGWLKKPSPGLVPMICIACKTILPGMIKIAKEYRIKFIILGGNPYEYTSFKKELLNVSRDQSYKSTSIKSIFGAIRETFKNPSYYHPMCISTLIKGYLYTDPYSLGPRLFAADIKFIDLFHYIPWEEKEVISRIKSELNWDYPKHLKSNWRFDCRIGHLKDLLYLKTIYMTEKDDLYAKMVREGMISRKEALLRLKEENKIYYDEIKGLLDKVGIKDTSVLNKLET